jgi:hypothetical protein
MPSILSRRRLVAATALLVCASQPARGELDIVVPAYFYPSAGSPWGPMTAAADDVPITAIMNPGNGPGNFKDNNYVAVVNAFRTAGGRVLGYVYTSYGTRSLAAVTADIDRYKMWYGIDGIFVDEMANTGPAERLNYYKAIYDHAKTVDPAWEVMGNPGTTTIEQYLTWPTADRLMVFENVSTQYPGYTPSAWNQKYDSSRFVHLVHTEPSGATMRTRLEQALDRGVGGIYVTDDVMNNPWNTLPTYWQAEVTAVAEINASFVAGDFNEDGLVNAADLAKWKGAFAQTADADADGDGASDGEDFLTWQRHVGLVASPAAALGVPEPGAAMLFVAAGLLMYAASGRRF